METTSEATEYKTYDQIQEEFVDAVLDILSESKSEVADRNEKMSKLDEVIYGDGLAYRLQIPAGHDKTEVNWLRRAVEIHTDQFMGNGFQVVSTYDSKDVTTAADGELETIKAENKASKEYADQRRNVIQNIIDDNGGVVLFKELAGNASAVGTSVIKSYYDEDAKKWVLSQVENVENFYAVWSDNNFRETDAVAYVYQISKQKAAKLYGCGEDIPTSPLGQPLEYAYNTTITNYSDQEMVTVIEVTGYVEEWAVKNGKLAHVNIGQETELNALIVGDKVKRLISKPTKLPRYYILPNRRYRKRPWGVSDISDAAIDINLTYIETLSDWRTVASKVNFPKFKAYGMSPEVQLPKPKPRTVEIIPLADGQDIQFINQGDANQFDFNAQLTELKEQFVRETGISRVLFSDPSVALNSNQALMTSMKPTTDIAEAKKALWQPILSQMFTDILNTLAEYDPTVKELVSADDSWTLKVIYPDYVAKYDPSAFSMLLNRFNAGLISAQSFMEQLGESKEEVDRIADEMETPITAAIVGKQLPAMAQHMITQPQQSQQPAPGQPPMPPTVQQGPMITTPGQNVPGTGIMSQPGSGASTTTPQGAVAQQAQQAGA